jgi:BMFP domain-containing protein YqiC
MFRWSMVMTQSANRLFDELSRLVVEAAGAAQGVKREIDTFAKDQIEHVLRDSNFATRDEVEGARAIALAAREENEALKARLEALEARIMALENPAPQMR